MSDEYKKAGVDIDKANAFVAAIKKMTDNIDVKGFSGLFDISKIDMHHPFLSLSTDGVGTKLDIAQLCEKHSTIGIDLVAMCVNDIIVSGARPICFLDYFATGKLNPDIAKEVLVGIIEGCTQADCALVGGETAEMPDMYNDGNYDLAGFSVGIVDKDKIIDGKNIKNGDVIIGLQSSGIHSNGYSLVRKLFFKDNNFHIKEYIKDIEQTLGEALLQPTKIYVRPILATIEKFPIKGIVHNTGGGFIDNISRILPNTCSAVIDKKSWEPTPIFSYMQKLGNISDDEMYKVFNMGIGMMLIVEEQYVHDIIYFLESQLECCFKIGKVTSSIDEKVKII